MQNLIEFWKDYYYIEPILDIVLCVTLIISLKKRKKFNNLYYIPLYILSLLLVCIFNALHSLSYAYHLQGLFRGFADYLDYIFTLTELIIFSHFYYNLTNNTTIKKLIVPINLGVFTFFVSLFITDKEFYKSISEKTQNVTYTTEGVILLLLCLSYFIELFKKPPILKLKNEPAFWVSTGLLFFLACTLPFSLLENYIREQHSNLLFWTYPIFYIFYILLFLMIIRAYLCKQK